MIKKLMTAVVVAGLALVGAFGMSDVARADDVSNPTGNALKVSPSGTRLQLEGGTTIKGDDAGCVTGYSDGCYVKVENLGQTEFSYRVYISPYIVSGADNELSFSDEGSTAYTQISRWIKIKNSAGEYVREAVFTIEPGETQTIEYKVEVPEDVPGGSQYAVIWAQIVNDQNDGGINTVGQVGSVISARTDGDTVTSAEFSDLHVDGFSFGGNVSASGKVNNTGNTDFVVTYTYIAKTFFGKEVYRSEQTLAAFPETEYEFESVWENPPLLGLFTVEFQVSGADTGKTIHKVVVIMPLIVMILLILLLTIIVAWIIIIIRKRKERKARTLV